MCAEQALQHPLEDYAAALRSASLGASWRHVLLSSDDRSARVQLVQRRGAEEGCRGGVQRRGAP